MDEDCLVMEGRSVAHRLMMERRKNGGEDVMKPLTSFAHSPSAQRLVGYNDVQCHTPDVVALAFFEYDLS
jgi:hypothetical protein